MCIFNCKKVKELEDAIDTLENKVMILETAIAKIEVLLQPQWAALVEHLRKDKDLIEGDESKWGNY